MLAIASGLPMPLTTVQLLWLNLVTGGSQDLPLTLEKAEGEELKQKPRPVGEPIFNRLMTQRITLNGIFIGGVCFALFRWLLQHGYTIDAARNILLLLMVLFENIQVLNSRSERLSIFQQPFFSNPLLLLGICFAQVLQIAAMNIPLTQKILMMQPVSAIEWTYLLAASFVLLAINEVYKIWWRRKMP